MSQDQYQMSNEAAPDEVAARHQLGERIDAYPYQKVQGLIVIIVFLFIIIGEVILCLPFGFLIMLGPFLLPTSPGENISLVAQVAATGFGVLLVAAFLGVIWYCIIRIINTYRGFGTTIYLYTGGLILTKGNKVDVVRWDQVSDVRASVQRGQRFRTTHTYKIRFVDGRKVVFNDLFENAQLLGDYLMQKNLTGRAEAK